MESVYIGNKELLNLPKTAFLCPRNISSNGILKCYDWATEQQNEQTCVISGFHSKIEKDVLHFLLKGYQPVILVLGRSLYKQLPTEFIVPLQENRMLIVSPVSQKINRHSKETALKRNRYIIEHTEKVVFGYLNKESSLYPIWEEAIRQSKRVKILSENL